MLNSHWIVSCFNRCGPPGLPSDRWLLSRRSFLWMSENIKFFSNPDHEGIHSEIICKTSLVPINTLAWWHSCLVSCMGPELQVLGMVSYLLCIPVLILPVFTKHSCDILIGMSTYVRSVSIMECVWYQIKCQYQVVCSWFPNACV